MLAGVPFAHELDFGTGLPTGAVVYSVLGNDNLPLVGYDTLSVTPIPGSLSLVLLVPGSANTCSKPLFEVRTLTWTYVTANGLVTGRTRYRVEKQIPFPVTEDGVRTKLGVEPQEIEDREINLLLAYATLAALYPTGALDAYAASGDLATLIVTDAIEATAALNVLPSLQLAVAKSEDSGTNKYSRFGSVDWKALEEGLRQIVFKLDAQMGVTADSQFGTLFIAVGPTLDRVTGGNFV